MVDSLEHDDLQHTIHDKHLLQCLLGDRVVHMVHGDAENAAGEHLWLAGHFVEHMVGRKWVVIVFLSLC